MFLKDFYENPEYSDSKKPLESWYYETKKAQWNSWTDIKEKYSHASTLKDNIVVFNIGGNKYRLLVSINYPAKIVYTLFCRYT